MTINRHSMKRAKTFVQSMLFRLSNEVELKFILFKALTVIQHPGLLLEIVTVVSWPVSRLTQCKYSKFWASFQA